MRACYYESLLLTCMQENWFAVSRRWIAARSRAGSLARLDLHAGVCQTVRQGLHKQQILMCTGKCTSAGGTAHGDCDIGMELLNLLLPLLAETLMGRALDLELTMKGKLQQQSPSQAHNQGQLHCLSSCMLRAFDASRASTSRMS